MLKDAEEDELLETIWALRRGESRLTPQIARKVMDQFRRLAPIREVEPVLRVDTEPLSEKEERILQLIAEGMTTRQIANALFLAEGTVKNYVSRIMEHCTPTPGPNWPLGCGGYRRARLEGLQALQQR